MAPRTTMNIRDGGLGIAGPGAEGIAVVLGCSAKAKVSKLYSANDPTVLKDAIGDGPLFEACNRILAVAGGPVYAMGVGIATDGAVGAVSKAGSGTAVLTPTAKPFAEVRIKATTTGEFGTAKARVSLDGGVTYGDEFTLPASAAATRLADAPGITITPTSGAGDDVTAGDLFTIATDGTVTVSRVAASTGTIALTSSSVVDAFDVKVQVLVAGANLAAGTAQVRYSLDGGDNYSPAVAVPTSGKLVLPGAGVLLTFADGTFVVGDLYSFTTTGPSYTTTEANTALDALAADPTVFEFIYVVGAPSSAAGAASLVAAVQTKLDAMKAAFRYVWAVVECGSDTDANFKTAFLNTVADRVCAVPGDIDLITSSGRYLRRPAGCVVAARAAAVVPSEDLGRVASGPVGAVNALFRDERATPGLDDQRFTTLTTILGVRGYFITQGLTMASATSDYSLLANRRVMDKACRVGRAELVNYMNEKIRVSGTTGKILEREALQIEKRIEGVLAAALGPGKDGGECSALSVYVDRDENILSTKKLPVKIRIVPFGYAKEVEGDIGFTNPKLALA